MTIGEIERFIKGVAAREERAIKIRASYDYVLANLITKGISIAFNGGKFPSIEETYPDLFKEEIESIQQPNMMKSVANFIAFAHSWNNKRHKEK